MMIRHDWIKYLISLFFGYAAYRILVPQPGVEPGLQEVKALSPNHWATREFPVSILDKN